MGIADMDFPSPPEVVDAIQHRLKHNCFGYTYPSDTLKTLICDFLRKKHSWEIDPSWIVFYPDATTSMYFILQGLTNTADSKDRKVILQPPVFSMFFNDVKRAGLQSVNNPLTEDDYNMDFDDLQSHLAQKAHSLILCNPQNPIGKVWDKDTLRRLGDLCAEYDCPIISDELHSDLVLPGFKHTPIASLSKEIEQNTITLYSPGKGFNISGVKISIAIIPNPKFREPIQFITNNMDPNIFALAAYESILRHGEHYNHLIVDYLARNFEYLDSYLKLNLPQFYMTPAQATFLAWVDMRSLNMNSENLNKFLIDKAKISASMGSAFGTEGFVRLNIGMSRFVLAKALESLKTAVLDL